MTITEEQTSDVTDAWVTRYLAMLGVPRERPSLDALYRLTHAHRAVPFENVTSLLRARQHLGQTLPAIDPEEQLSAWEARRSGGICFEVADTFSRLLAGLGYDASAILC